MSKSVILMRHAKSSWAYNLPDHKRPLKDRGKTDAVLVANEFKQKNVQVDKIFSSHAKRALETCKIVHKNLDWNFEDVEISETMYDFGGTNVLNFIKNLPNNLNTIMVFGHNHAFTALANTLGSIFIENLPTSGLIKLNFEVENWEEISEGKTEFLITPKALKL